MQKVTYPLLTDNGQAWPKYVLVDGEIHAAEPRRVVARNAVGTPKDYIAIRVPNKWRGSDEQYFVVNRKATWTEKEMLAESERLQWDLVRKNESGGGICGDSRLMVKEYIPAERMKEVLANA